MTRWETGVKPTRQPGLVRVRLVVDSDRGPVRPGCGFGRSLLKPTPEACCHFLRTETLFGLAT